MGIYHMQQAARCIVVHSDCTLVESMAEAVARRSGRIPGLEVGPLHRLRRIGQVQDPQPVLVVGDEGQLADGHDVLFDIDWQGTQQLSEKARGDVVSVFILPPSIPELEQRLHKRAQDDYETIHRRMAKAADEMSHWAEYDYVVINRDLDTAFADVKAILAAERLKRERQPGLSDFVRGLQAKL